jgi:DNA-binding PadR family transcriptional regulator
MRGLESSGLLEKVDEQRGYYRITNKGRQYLSGELDAEDLKKEE